MVYNIVRFDISMLALLPRPQEPFEIIGRLVPIYNGQEWKVYEELLDTPREKLYPDDSFDPMTYIDNPDEAAFLAMLDGNCVGSLRVCKRWNKNAFIDDLAIDRAHRGKGVGTMLMNAAVDWGKEHELYGVSLETQDWNLRACRFYLKYGFKLGGIDRNVYDAHVYRGETALYFYLLPE
ncbi:MAG: GNAT family N-acetyltransferase [Oscillospiraceae bacterium]|nr:GNAT family N-acetyltransferase [Oscillospiraceae bacterium]